MYVSSTPPVQSVRVPASEGYSYIKEGAGPNENYFYEKLTWFSQALTVGDRSHAHGTTEDA